MKYKILLAGSNQKLINDFFMQMDFYFECLTSSMLYNDLKNHLEYFKPDMFVLCMRSETRDDLTAVASFHDILSKDKIPYTVISDNANLEFISKISGGKPDMSLLLPISNSSIQDEITGYIVKHKSAAYTESIHDTQSAPVSGHTLDLMSQIDEEINKMQSGVQEKGPSLRQPEIIGRRRILVIDDATIVHKTIKGHLDNEYEVATAISGKIALRFLHSKEVSLILLDYEMPEMNGPAVLKKLREDPYLSKIPVVFLTGINDTEKIKNALSLKPQGYLLKPVDRKALIDKIHELIN